MLSTAKLINVLKFRTILFFCSQIKYWHSGLELTKYLSEQQAGKILVRLLLKKHSDLGLHCLSGPSWQSKFYNIYRSLQIVLIDLLAEVIIPFWASHEISGTVQCQSV